MRKITTHQTNGLNAELDVSVHDEAGAGGAHHHYEIGPRNCTESFSQIKFQNGPIKESGVNGISHEALLAVLIDRLRCFQSGDFSCRENAIALTKLEEGLHWLNARTAARIQRNVEGTSVK